MNLHELTPDNQAILKCVRLDYFWQSIPFDRLYTALDIGAHIGLWSTVCREYAPHMDIIALEPHIENYLQLVERCPDVSTVHGYCGYQDAAGLCVRKGMEGSHYVLRPDEQPASNGRVIPLPARYALEDFGAIDLLKLDCEGSEFDILLHCEDATLEGIQVIVGEYHLERGNLSDLITRLSECGFSLAINPSEGAPHLGHFLAMRGE